MNRPVRAMGQYRDKAGVLARVSVAVTKSRSGRKGLIFSYSLELIIQGRNSGQKSGGES